MSVVPGRSVLREVVLHRGDELHLGPGPLGREPPYCTFGNGDASPRLEELGGDLAQRRLVAHHHDRAAGIGPARGIQHAGGVRIERHARIGLESRAQRLDGLQSAPGRAHQDAALARQPRLQPLGHRLGLLAPALREGALHVGLAARVFGFRVPPEDEVHRHSGPGSGSARRPRVVSVMPPRMSAIPTRWKAWMRSPRKIQASTLPKTGMRCMKTPAMLEPTSWTARFQKTYATND